MNNGVEAMIFLIASLIPYAIVLGWFLVDAYHAPSQKQREKEQTMRVKEYREMTHQMRLNYKILKTERALSKQKQVENIPIEKGNDSLVPPWEQER